MKFFDRIRESQAVQRLNDEALHAVVLREVESGLRRDGLWARALSETATESEALRLYIRLRVQSLRDEQTVIEGLGRKMDELHRQAISSDSQRQTQKSADLRNAARERARAIEDEKKRGPSAIIDCPQCSQKLRVPTHRTLRVTCKRCGSVFTSIT